MTAPAVSGQGTATIGAAMPRPQSGEVRRLRRHGLPGPYGLADRGGRGAEGGLFIR